MIAVDPEILRATPGSTGLPDREGAARSWGVEAGIEPAGGDRVAQEQEGTGPAIARRTFRRFCAAHSGSWDRGSAIVGPRRRGGGGNGTRLSRQEGPYHAQREERRHGHEDDHSGPWDAGAGRSREWHRGGLVGTGAGPSPWM